VHDPFFAEAARTKRPVSSSHVAADPRASAVMRDVVPHRSQLFVPIVVKEQMIGGFGLIWYERARQFTASELALMEVIANQAGAAIDNARLFEENRRQVQELAVLHELSRAVTGELEQAALIDAIHAQVARVLDVRNMVIALCDEERGELEIVLRTVAGVPDMRPPLRYPERASGLTTVVRETGRAIRTDHYEAECGRHGVQPIQSSAALRHWLGVPMAAGDRVLGVLVLRGGERPFTAHDERLLTNIAHLAALALRSARLFEDRTRAYREVAAAQDQLVRTEKLRALGEMASGVAHDFNNLLASILGRAQLVLQRVQNPQLRQWLQVIERAALDGAQTVRRLQEFTRIRRDHPFVAVDLNEVVREALEITQSRWREEALSRGVTLEVRNDLSALPKVAGDPAELREALTNLILNAVDAMPNGGVLTLTTAVAEGEIVVTVGDTGVGIPQTIRHRIFDPFFTTKGPHGTGLGLSMTYGILERHGARIAVDSEEGRGTTFRLTFIPTWELEPPEAAPAALAPAVEVSLRCLVVDDEPAVGAVLGDVLETGGHRAVVVTDGSEAIARFGAESFDVVFTDLAMPRVSGWQVARAIKEMAPAVPIILVTGFGVELSAEERRAHNVDLVLVKPLKIQEILDVVAQLARGRVWRT
jgi:signal transduction histidine kinase/CheY-like chemotaxis protein